MRTPLRSLALSLALALGACTSGRVVVVRPQPAPPPVRYVEPLEVDIARPHKGRLYVQTNRAAYVAIFEIVPGRGVSLVYPVSARQRRFIVSGLRDVPVWWESSRVTYHAGWSASREYPGRYIYAIASDEPLLIADAAFQHGYLRDVLGSRVYYASNPYMTMRALAREFVPAVADDGEWAEDAYVLSPSYATERYRVTRVYCRGTVYEVPWELADRVWCPSSPRGVGRDPGRVTEVDLPGYRRPLTRPDSVVSDNGRRVAVRPPGPNGRGLVHRVTDPGPRPADRAADPTGPVKRNNGRVGDDDRPGNGPVQERPGQGDENRRSGPDPRRGLPPNDRFDERPPRGRGADVTEDRVAHDRPDRVTPGRDGEPGRPLQSDDVAKPERANRPDRSASTSSETSGSRGRGRGPRRDATAAPGPDARGGAARKAPADTQSSASTPADTTPQPAADAKPQPSSNGRGGPEKGHAKPDGKDDKPGNGKTKRP